MTRIAKVPERVLQAATLLLFLLAWQLASSAYPSDQFPSPLNVLLGFSEIARNGVLIEHVSISLFRFSLAYLLAAILAIPLGLLLGGFKTLQRASDPLVQLLRPISPIAWFPLAVLWFGIGNLPAIFIIFLASFFPVLLAAITGVRHVDPLYLKVAANFGASRSETFLKIIWPAAFPHIMVGLNIALGTGWIHLVAGEMLGAQSGLGFMIVDARNFLRTDLIIAGMLLVGLLGLLINAAIRHLEQRVIERWGALP
ncbi:MAG: transporter, rane protein [Burkholderiaceae bacterium]|nr:transporter, rane protein [Burkholderiaceae bacterium]